MYPMWFPGKCSNNEVLQCKEQLCCTGTCLGAGPWYWYYNHLAAWLKGQDSTVAQEEWQPPFSACKKLAKRQFTSDLVTCWTLLVDFHLKTPSEAAVLINTVRMEAGDAAVSGEVFSLQALLHPDLIFPSLPHSIALLNGFFTNWKAPLFKHLMYLLVNA